MASEKINALRQTILWYYSRGYDRQMIKDKLKQNPRFASTSNSTVNNAYDYVVLMSRSAGYLKNSNSNKPLGDVSIVGSKSSNAVIRATVSALYDFPATSKRGKSGKQSVSFTFDFDQSLTVGDMQKQIRDKLTDFFNSKYNLRTNRRRITNIQVDFLERV